MALSFTPATLTIYVPQNYLAPVTGLIYTLDVDVFRLDLKDYEDSEEGIVLPDTHRHNTTVTISGIAYDRTVEIINGWIVDFEDTGTPYIVSCTGANHNLSDVSDFSAGNVSMLSNNSAGRTIVEVPAEGLTLPQFLALK
jgi:hypothetical protein